MTNREKPSSSYAKPKASDGVGMAASPKPEEDTPNVAGEHGLKTDRPGFDLGGSSGDTHAGAGLGLGEDAFDTPGDRRLPGRRLDNKLTIPRWSGPESRRANASEKKTEVAKDSPIASDKKDQ